MKKWNALPVNRKRQEWRRYLWHQYCPKDFRDTSPPHWTEEFIMASEFEYLGGL